MKQVKIVLLSAMSLLSGMFLYGQAREASVMIENENHHAIMIQIDQPEKDAREALKLRLERSGLKERLRNGVVKYKGVTLSEISPDKLDIYTKVEAGPNNSSVVYMAVSRGYNNFANSMADSSITQNVKKFLQSFIMDAQHHSADIGITSQVNDISKDEKKYRQLLDEQADLQKKRSAIDSRLLEIQNDLYLQKENIDKKKVTLGDAKVKRGKL
jgi:NhaP-type Na+/H+ and K+/H+ antiporter